MVGSWKTQDKRAFLATRQQRVENGLGVEHLRELGQLSESADEILHTPLRFALVPKVVRPARKKRLSSNCGFFDAGTFVVLDSDKERFVSDVNLERLTR